MKELDITNPKALHQLEQLGLLEKELRKSYKNNILALALCTPTLAVVAYLNAGNTIISIVLFLIWLLFIWAAVHAFRLLKKVVIIKAVLKSTESLRR